MSAEETGEFVGLRERILKALEPYDIPTGAWTAAERMEPVDAVLAEVRSAVEAVAGPLLDHWAECPLPPDAGCADCNAWWQARRVLVPLADRGGQQ